jgi:hypothetical protein
MSKTKYIVFKDGGNEEIVIFGCTQNHSDIADFMRLGKDDIVSAGFVNIYIDSNDKIVVHCYGKSDSLELDARIKKDTFLAKFALDPNDIW